MRRDTLRQIKRTVIKMRNFIKIACVTLVLVIMASLASCSLTKQYSYKTDDIELPMGVYIYNLYSAYSQAQQYAQKSDLYDSEKGTYDGKKSFLKMEITDDDGKTATADEWIADKADEYTMNILAIYHEFNRLGSTIDEATLSSYEQQAKEVWEKGYYYQYYGENPYSDIYEPLGVSYESFYIATYYSGAMQEAVFNDLYGATGEQAVTDDQLTDFFTENYTSYRMFHKDLYTTEQVASTDDDGNETTDDVDTALSKDEIKAITADFKSYVNDIKDGKSIDDVVADYTESEGLDSDPSQSGVEIMKDSSIGDNLVAEIDKLKEGKASYAVIGDDENTRVIYFFYKAPIADSIEAYIGDETQRATVLQEMKGDTFNDYLDEVAESLEVSISSTCKSVNPSRFEESK